MTSIYSSFPDAVQDTRHDAKENYEAEKMTLLIANQEQEKKLAKYKAQIRELKSKQQPQPEDGSDGLFDVLPWKPHPGTPEPPAETDENLEDSMKKVYQYIRTYFNAKIRRSVANRIAKLLSISDKVSKSFFLN